MSGAPGPLSPDAQARRRRRLAWIVPVVAGLLFLVVLAAALRVGWGLVAVLLGFAAVVAVISVLLHRTERAKRATRAPADPTTRADPPLDMEKVRSALRRGGTIAGVREVRRQAPWLSLGEAAALVDQVEG